MLYLVSVIFSIPSFELFVTQSCIASDARLRRLQAGAAQAVGAAVATFGELVCTSESSNIWS